MELFEIMKHLPFFGPMLISAVGTLVIVLFLLFFFIILQFWIIGSSIFRFRLPYSLISLFNVPFMWRLVLYLAVGYIIFCELNVNTIIFNENRGVDQLIAIHAGIGALLISLYVAITQGTYRHIGLEQSQVLFKRTGIHILTVIEIIVFLSLIFPGFNKFSLLFTAVVGVEVVWQVFFIATYYTLHSFRKQLHEDVFNHANQSYIKSIIERRRKTNNYYRKLKELEDKYQISITFFSLDSPDNNIILKSNKTGIVSDIDLDQLDNLLKQISLFDQQVSTTNATNNNLQSTTLEHKRTVCIRLRPFDNVSTNDPLIFLEKNKFLADDSQIAEIQNTLSKVFFVIEKKLFSADKEIKIAISTLKSDVIDAIIGKNSNSAEELSKIFVMAGNILLDELHKCGANFSARDAKEENSSIFRDAFARARDDFIDDIRDIYDEALITNHPTIIRNLSGFPYGLVISSIRNNDHVFFSPLAHMLTRPYHFAIKTTDYDIKTALVKSSYQHLQEISEFEIIPSIEKHHPGEANTSLESLKDFMIGIFRAYLWLLKTAYEKKDITSFESFLYSVNKLMRYSHDENIWSIESQLSRGDLDINERNNLTKDLEKIKVIQELKKSRSEMLFVLAAWVLGKVKTDENSLEFFKALDNHIPSETQELTDLFFSARGDRRDNMWGCDFWDIPSDGEFHSVDFDGYISNLYCIKLLAIISENTELDQKPRDSWRYLGASDGPLIKFLSALPQDIKTYPSLCTIVGKNLGNIPILSSLILKEYKKQDDRDRVLRQTAQLSNEKINKFLEEFLKTINESALLRNVFKHFSLYKENLSKYKKTTKYLGVRTIDFKGPFIDQNHTHWLNHSSSYSRGFITGENSSIIRSLLKKSKEVEAAEIDKMIDDLSHENLIFITSWQGLNGFFERSGNFKSIWGNKVPIQKYLENEFKGVYISEKKEIPVLQVATNDELSSFVLLIRVQQIQAFIQEKPFPKKEAGTYHLVGVFGASIRSFSDDTALLNETISKPPKWLEDIGDKDRQNEYLLERVQVDLKEKFKLQLKTGNVGYYFKVQK